MAGAFTPLGGLMLHAVSVYNDTPAGLYSYLGPPTIVFLHVHPIRMDNGSIRPYEFHRLDQCEHTTVQILAACSPSVEQ